MITKIIWNKTSEVGVPPQRVQVVCKNKRTGADVVVTNDDECLVIWEGKIKRSRYLTEEKRWEGHTKEQTPEYWVFIRDLTFCEE